MQGVVVVSAFVAVSLGLYFFGNKLFPNGKCCSHAGEQESKSGNKPTGMPAQNVWGKSLGSGTT